MRGAGNRGIMIFPKTFFGILVKTVQGLDIPDGKMSLTFRCEGITEYLDTGSWGATETVKVRVLFA